jgi:hypothetical protein
MLNGYLWTYLTIIGSKTGSPKNGSSFTQTKMGRQSHLLVRHWSKMKMTCTSGRL